MDTTTNNKKNIIIVVLILIALVAGVIWFATKDKEEPIVEGEVPALAEDQKNSRGVILTIDTEQAAVDGPYVVTISSGDTIEEIRIPSMGIMLCAARPNIADVYMLKEGMEVEVRGTIGEEGAIIPCESADHYLRVTSGEVQGDYKG